MMMQVCERLTDCSLLTVVKAVCVNGSQIALC